MFKAMLGHSKKALGTSKIFPGLSNKALAWQFQECVWRLQDMFGNYKTFPAHSKMCLGISKSFLVNSENAGLIGYQDEKDESS